MMLTMHSVLRDRNRKRAVILDIGLLVASTILCALTFATETALVGLGFSSSRALVVIQVVGILTFVLSLVGLRVDWKEQSAKHDRACKVLARLKGSLRAGDTAMDDAILSAQLADLVAVPDHQFPALKAQHLRKVVASRMIDRIPGCPLWIIKMRILLGDLRTGLRGGWVDGDEDRR
jgi:hypothetical protein